MRIEGHHPSGQRVVIIKNSNQLFDLFIYSNEGELKKEGEYRSIERAKKSARKSVNIDGRWYWDIRLKLKAQHKDDIDF